MEIKTADFVTSMAEYGKFPGKGLPQIAVAGKSNVGKSTLINCLCRRNKLARTSSTPGGFMPSIISFAQRSLRALAATSEPGLG